MAKGWKAEAVIVRELPEITIVFLNSESIYAFPKDGGRGSVFHKWWAPLGFYTAEWGDFRRKMLRNKNLTIRDCYRLANRHEVVAQSTGRSLESIIESLTKIKRRS